MSLDWRSGSARGPLRASGRASARMATLGLASALISTSGCGATSDSGAANPLSQTAGASAELAPAPAALAVSAGSPRHPAPLHAAPVHPTVPLDDERPTVTAFEGYEKIHLKPNRDTPVIGLMRAGQSVPLRSPEVVEGNGVSHCKGGWYEVLPRGFVCVGVHSSLRRDDPRALAAAEALPDLSGALPFSVGTLAADSPFYRRIPKRDEQLAAEPGLDAYLAHIPGEHPEYGAIDRAKAGRGPSEAFVSYQRLAPQPLTADRKAYEGRQIAWATEFDAEGRTWLVTPNMHIVPKDKVFRRPLSVLRGVDLRSDRERPLPLAFAWSGDIDRFVRDEAGRFVPSGQTWSHHGFVPLTGEQVLTQGYVFWQARSGEWVRHTDVTIIKKKEERPKGVGPHDKWIHVRITWGTLVAYEGDQPVFATAISAGADGVSARDNGHHTRLGIHNVGWKMFSADMNGTDKATAWAVDDVPFTAYYKDSFALHGAWWHDEFGRPKSHGCVNLSPADARFLWDWIDPGMPEGWYAVTAFYPEVKGTVVEVRP